MPGMRRPRDGEEEPGLLLEQLLGQGAGPEEGREGEGGRHLGARIRRSGPVDARTMVDASESETAPSRAFQGTQRRFSERVRDG